MSGVLPPDEARGGPDHTVVNVPLVTVRYWAAARAAAGLEEESVPAATLAEVLVEVHARHPNRAFANALRTCSVLVGELPVGSREPADVRLATGDRVEFLPPFAGG